MSDNVRQSRDYLDPSVLSRLGGLALRARTVVEGYVSGVHRSPFHGFSVEFAEHREYAPGDDLRYLDWKVFGRSDKFYLKQFEEETNLVCYLMMDVSASMTYRGPEAAMSKLGYAQSIAAALSYLVLHQQDCVALATFDDQLRAILPPSSNPSRLEQFGQAMDEIRPREKTAMTPIFHELAQRWKRRGIVFIISDFFDDVDAMLGGLKHLRHRRQEVVLLHVLDRAELEFPFDDAMRFEGLEDGGAIEAEPRALRSAYLTEFQNYLHHLRSGCRAEGIDYALLPTDQPLEVGLSTYLASRASGRGREGVK